MTYGCYNRKPFIETTKVQDGWIDYGNSRIPLMVTHPFRMSKECEYQKESNDSGCSGCQHKETK